MDNVDPERDAAYSDARIRSAEEAELQEWKKWAESWITEIDGGAGEEGTDKVVNRYKNDTPGQGENEHNSR